MSKYTDEDLIARLLDSMGKKVEIVGYGLNPEGGPINVALENIDEGKVIIDFDLVDFEIKGN
jgi:hypothetical protein